MTKARSNTRTYHIWENMKQRCYNPNASGYSYYGGRGISVCAEWQSYDNFLSDMGEVPSDLHSIDRIDSNGDYSPDNCRWADKRQQSLNTRMRKDNTSGATGVSYSKKDSRWMSTIVNPKGSKSKFTRRYFRTKEEAIEYNTVARKLAYGERV